LEWHARRGWGWADTISKYTKGVLHVCLIYNVELKPTGASVRSTKKTPLVSDKCTKLKVT